MELPEVSETIRRRNDFYVSIDRPTLNYKLDNYKLFAL